ncbi:hypothetical protein B0A67_15575 [Flavobacterium aquidurense]|jgi:hypothetical protein|uniref:hypothetical protein n=1 Tax=Flavobacterium aquidurense TaxID=362413 RepID=UPI0009106DA7|nr:hypothetical protein [Flavobacterium aquidurense]OXA70644.1 hypothetical protein B0A67_15575 [Flavobacterium aquidurense]SHG29363.1 hypothetical protein SAMN05444481_103265 [Flavobacterium frigidimaris]
MYKGFNLSLNSKELSNFQHYYKIGEENYLKLKKPIDNNFRKFLFSPTTIDGTELQENWFPNLNADIFISHSHDDKQLAIAFSGWLYENFGLIAFIDSCLWGSSDNLLQGVNDNYSVQNLSPKLYSYSDVNYASSHIHMMLMNALTMMIDKCECFIVINTPNSIQKYETLNKSESPWIYNEIALSKFIRINIPDRFKIIIESKTFSAEKDTPQLKINYNLDLDHLTKIDSTFLAMWLKKHPTNELEALNYLYKLK